MAIKEVFKNPTVREVIFQIRYPNLFYIENHIGKIQQRIIKDFPESALIFRKQITYVDLGAQHKIEDFISPQDETSGNKIWQFESEKGYRLNIESNMLAITSTLHKTYNNKQSSDRFRDIIQNVLDNFFEVLLVPKINRIGLRYIDECPIPKRDNAEFRKFYKTVLPISRFNLKNSDEMEFFTISKIGKHYLRYKETLKFNKEKPTYILDFDGFTHNIEPNECLAMTDMLHDIISKEYEKTIKEPVKEWMRRPKKKGKTK